MKPLKTSTLIHLFALLHALVAFICASFAFSDQLILTLLTIILTVIICSRHDAGIELLAACIILVNIIGFVLGTLGAQLVSSIVSNTAVTHALSSLVTTELMGGSVFLIARYNAKLHGKKQKNRGWSPKVNLFIFLIVLILAVRIIYTAVFHSSLFADTQPSSVIGDYFINPIVFLITVCINVIYINQIQHNSTKQLTPTVKFWISVLFLIGMTMVSALFACFGLDYNMERMNLHYYLQMTTIASIFEITTFTVLSIIHNFLTYRAEMYKERQKANQARYRYMMLKQQVDPHFLFNSLNILDCLVMEQKTAQASTYIHKLAGIYRYMLQNEEKDMVTLGDELTFMNMYISLLKVRFEDGFEVKIDIADHLKNKKIVPCSLQLLVENAIKHNVVNPSDPLLIEIEATEHHISVRNNIHPKVSDSLNSNKLGLKYIDIQYLNLIGKHIHIIHDDKLHQVILPFPD